MEQEVSVPCHIDLMGLMDMDLGHHTIHLWVFTHSMVGLSMALSLEQVVVAFHGVEAVAECSVEGEDSVVGGGNKKLVAWGTSTALLGIGCIQSPEAIANMKL